MSAELMKSKFIHRPSVHLWHRLSLKLLHGFLSNFGCSFPRAIYPDSFFIFEKKIFFNFLRIFFVFVNMGPYGSENFKKLLFLQKQPKAFNLFLHFLLKGPHKIAFGIVWNFENWNFNYFFSFSLTWDPMRVKISKSYSSYKSQPKAFKFFLNFLPNGPHKTTFVVFEMVLRFLMIYFRKFQIKHCSILRNQKHQLSVKRAIVHQNGVKFGTRGYYFNI